ncbi:MAG TPA: Rieske 2Fe-2S domain-containing protein [Symbiobacteriaceae bacterium]|nr:Rieske 2Fe-2S domain-containing protein [Symbiobacteriaceae bacterium]
MAEEKKAPAGAAAPPMADGITRRQALRSGMFATVGAFFATVGGGSAAMFWPIKLTGFGGVIPVPKKLNEIKVGEVVTVREGKFYLTRTEAGLMALYWKCVHLGCTVPWNQSAGKFMCPCHGSVYTLDGQNVAGPAPRPLDMMEIKVTGQDITVNTGKIKQRVAHDPSHVTKV